ncbi:hypothetical protein [Hyphomicrobium sp. LHD-15]|uniref:nuclear transport factor 2 family protein n=1 Tax=Hyphomicrobium sp. LHD-15 TaxID=3072142 RepID=UPI00280FD27A|nr:hypothetical protein [Hyphomicrobium sp. LHD-15]MDQ8700439.1 hypothetical protein [Hyphomicrobium sp. LHD-15]
MLTDEEAHALIANAHREWSNGNLDGMLDQFADSIEFWCNAGNLDGGPIEFKGKGAFRQSLEAVLRTTRSQSQLISFRFDGKLAHARASIQMQSLTSGATLEASYRQIISYGRTRISRIEEYHDAARLNAFWKLHAEGAAANMALWNVSPEPGALK